LCSEWSTQSAFHPAWSLLDHRRSSTTLRFDWSTQNAVHPAESPLNHRRSCDDGLH
jgi:hypothetical protein